MGEVEGKRVGRDREKEKGRESVEGRKDPGRNKQW